jgi:aspartyl protease family protein
VLSKGLANYAAQNASPKATARQAAAPAPVKANLPVRLNEHRISADPRGQFVTDAEINGSRVSDMLVDTGATAVVLSYEDAAAVGIYPAPADYKYSATTANGVAHIARVTLNQVRVGNLTVHDVDAYVGERGALSNSLLGMTFLSKLGRYEVASGALVLKQ